MNPVIIVAIIISRRPAWLLPSVVPHMKTVRMKKFSENDEAAADVDNDDIKDGNKKWYQKLPTFYFEKGTCML